MLVLKLAKGSVEGSGVISSAEASAVVDAQGIIAAAKDDAAEIIAAARAEAERIGEAAKERAKETEENGFQEGLKRARISMIEKNLELVQRSVDFMEANEKTMGEIVMTALRKCIDTIGTEAVVEGLVTKAMRIVVLNRKEVTIRVSPQTKDIVKARLDSILSNFPSVMVANVEADEKVKDDACIIETEAGVVEASVSEQIEAIEKSINKHFVNNK